MKNCVYEEKYKINEKKHKIHKERSRSLVWKYRRNIFSFFLLHFQREGTNCMLFYAFLIKLNCFFVKAFFIIINISRAFKDLKNTLTMCKTTIVLLVNFITFK